MRLRDDFERLGKFARFVRSHNNANFFVGIDDFLVETSRILKIGQLALFIKFVAIDVVTCR